MERPLAEPFKPAPAFRWEGLLSPSVHVKLLGVITSLVGLFGLLAFGLVWPLLVLFGGALGAFSSTDLSELIRLYPWVLAYFTVAVIAGIGLAFLKQWARYLVVGFYLLGMLNFPIGTIVGGCALVILLRRETARLFSPK